MPEDLTGRVALVTGGASGIGTATAKALAKSGAKVVVSDVSDGAALARDIGGAYVRHDVTSEDDWIRRSRLPNRPSAASISSSTMPASS